MAKSVETCDEKFLTNPNNGIIIKLHFQKSIFIQKFSFGNFIENIQNEKINNRKEECLLSKKKKALVVIAILSSLLLAFIGGQSYSKYVSEITGTGTLDVATWSFKVNGTTEERQTIPLSLTSYNPATLANGKIAPGTEGKFNIVLDGTESEVGIWYTVSIENASSTPRNLYFKYGGQDYPVSELGTILSGPMNVNDKRASTFTLPIEWYWRYETDRGNGIDECDVMDTEDAKNIQQCTFDIVVRAEQLQPEEV